MKTTQFYHLVWQNFSNTKKSIDEILDQTTKSLNEVDAKELQNSFSSIGEEGMRDAAISALSKFSKREIESMREMISLDDYEMRSVMEEALFVRGEIG